LYQFSSFASNADSYSKEKEEPSKKNTAIPLEHGKFNVKETKQTSKACTIKKIASIYPSGCNLTSKDEGIAAFKVLEKKKSPAITLRGAI
jgi:hypothetical protein